MIPGGLPDTTCEILYENQILRHFNNNTYGTSAKTNGGCSIIYKMDTPTNILYPAGIIPTAGGVIEKSEACIFVLDNNKEVFNYVNETTQPNGYNRWAQDESRTMTEFSQSWTLNQNYSYMQFSVDIRCLDRAYMYDKTSGQIWFAGVNTPYYGHYNISELS